MDVMRISQSRPRLNPLRLFEPSEQSSLVASLPSATEGNRDILLRVLEPTEISSLEASLPSATASSPDIVLASSLPLKYQGAPVILAKPTLQIVDHNAFAYNNKGQKRSYAAASKAQYRASQSIVVAINKLKKNERALALRDALSNPSVRETASAIAFDATSVANMHLQQTRKIIERATATDKKQGRTNNDKASFVQSIMVSVVGSPEQRDRNAPSRRKQVTGLGMKWATGQRHLAKAKVKRKALSVKEKGLMWSRVRNRKGYSKISLSLRKALFQWILDHPSIVPSPISKDTLLVRNPETGLKERVGKLLLEIPVRELHNDLIDDKTGLKEARNEKGEVLISDTALRYLLPKQIRKMTARHKQMCGCETCITMRSLQQSLNSYRARHLREMKKDLLEGASLLTEIEEYEATVFPKDTVWHGKPQLAIDEVMCKPAEGYEHRSWRCVLKKCNDCPQYQVPNAEKDTSNDAPRIRFHVYQPVTTCSVHGIIPIRSKLCPTCTLDEPSPASQNSSSTTKT